MYSCVYAIGKPKCSTLKLSSTEVSDDPGVKDAIAGTFQFIGEWVNSGSPIYRQVGGDPMSVNKNKFYLYHSDKQWILQIVRDLLCVFNSMKCKRFIEELLLKKN